MGRTNRGYKKKAPFRDALLKVVVGEGKAEIQYFDELHSQRIKFHILPYNEDNRSAPKYIVHNAREFVKKVKTGLYDFTRYDELWVLIDVDDNDDGQLQEAYEACNALEGARLGVSNPCFELWLLLHLPEFNPNTVNLLGKKGPGLCEKLLRDLAGGYNKVNVRMRDKADLPLACSRARDLDSPNHRWPQGLGSKVYQIFEGLNLSEIKFRPSLVS